MLQFLDVVLEENYDFLTIGYGKNVTDAALVMKISGSMSLTTVVIDANDVWMSFKTDMSTVKRGFAVSIEWIPGGKI